MVNANAKPKPVCVFRAGPVQIALWRHEQTLEGRTRVRHSATLVKQYLDKDQRQWKETGVYFEDDLADLETAVHAAKEWCRLRQVVPDAEGKHPAAGETSGT